MTHYNEFRINLLKQSEKIKRVATEVAKNDPGIE